VKLEAKTFRIGAGVGLKRRFYLSTSSDKRKRLQKERADLLPVDRSEAQARVGEKPNEFLHGFSQ